MKAFELFDRDGSGEIEYDELVHTLERLDVGLSEVQIFELMRGLDTNQDQTVNLAEFLHRFEPIFDAVRRRRGLVMDGAEGKADDGQALPHVAEGKQDHETDPGRASATEPGDVDVKHAPGDAKALSGAGRSETEQRLGRRHRRKSSWQAGIINQINNFIYQHRLEIASLFRQFDQDNSGAVDRQEFVEGFRRINKAFDQSLTDEQIISIMKSLDKDGDGKISYSEFLGAFRPVDARRNSVMSNRTRRSTDSSSIIQAKLSSLP